MENVCPRTQITFNFLKLHFVSSLLSWDWAESWSKVKYNLINQINFSLEMEFIYFLALTDPEAAVVEMISAVMTKAAMDLSFYNSSYNCLCSFISLSLVRQDFCEDVVENALPSSYSFF